MKFILFSNWGVLEWFINLLGFYREGGVYGLGSLLLY